MGKPISKKLARVLVITIAVNADGGVYTASNISNQDEALTIYKAIRMIEDNLIKQMTTEEKQDVARD